MPPTREDLNPPRHRPARLGLLAAFGLIAAGMVLSACGGSSSPSSGSAASAADSALKASKCMREHGIKNFPNPETAPGGGTTLKFNKGEVSRQTMEAAQRACRHFLEEGREQVELSPQQKVEQEEAVQKFAKCMREHGVKIEASTAGGGVEVKIGGPGAGGANPESPAFREAQEACQGLMPGPKGKGAPPGALPPPGGSASGSETGGGG
jgi:hypothetical protein